METSSPKDFFKGKRITVMGLGLLGRGIGDVAFLARQGAKLTVTDRKTKEELAPSLKKLSKFKRIRYVLRGHNEKDFISADMIIKAAGVPLDSPYIRAAKKAHVPIYMSTALFANFAKEKGATLVGVTGTRGKSTVTHLIAHILKAAKRNVVLGGNVRGLSTLPQITKIKAGDICVMELDSWQLQGFTDLKIPLDVAIFTSFMQDHLNYYSSMKLYFEDKAGIYRDQTKKGVLIAGPSAALLIKKDLKKVRGTFVAVKGTDVPKSWKRALVGDHNSENIACAASAARALGVSEAVIKKAVASFKPVEGRLQFLRMVHGVTIVNDNNGTTPDATIAAVKSMPQKGRTVLIMGGSDKGISFKSLILEIKKKKALLVLLPGSGTDRFKKEFKGAAAEVPSMKQAVDNAFSLAKAGDTILLSPACASFGLFKNEYDRNDQFVAAVKKL